MHRVVAHDFGGGVVERDHGSDRRLHALRREQLVDNFYVSHPMVVIFGA